MIIKSFEIKKINEKINLILFYGKNEGLKNEALDILIKEKIIFQTMKKKKFLIMKIILLKIFYLNLFLNQKNLLSLKELLIKF